MWEILLWKIVQGRVWGANLYLACDSVGWIGSRRGRRKKKHEDKHYKQVEKLLRKIVHADRSSQRAYLYLACDSVGWIGSRRGQKKKQEDKHYKHIENYCRRSCQQVESVEGLTCILLVTV